MSELVWILDYLPEIESDFSVFHRIDDIYSLDSRLFNRRVQYIAAYEGAVQARIINEHQRQNQDSNSLSVDAPKEIPSTEAGFVRAGLDDFVSFQKV